jgi:hypothetical protein
MAIHPDGRTVQRTRDQEYHARHAAEAVQILRELSEAGKKPSDPEVRRCVEYSKDVLHDKKFAPWLVVYTAVSGEFKEGWIPDNFYGARVIPAIQGRPGRLASLKSISRKFLGTSSLP